LAEVHFERGDYCAAAQEYQNVIANDPDDFQAWQQVACAYLLESGIHRAIEALEKSRKFYSMNLPLGLQLCGLYGMAQDYHKAIATYIELSDIHFRHMPSSPWIPPGTSTSQMLPTAACEK
jgi:tetratricopeptide (TPR) repeat protein